VTVPVVFQSFFCNSTLYKTNTSLRRIPSVGPCFFIHFAVTILAIGWTPLYDRQRTLLKPSTDTRELLYAVKIPQNGNVGAINDSKLQNVLNSLYFFTVLRVYTVALLGNKVVNVRL